MYSDSRTSSGGCSEEKGPILIDELTPDWPESSRYWPLEEYAHIKNLTSPGPS